MEELKLLAQIISILGPVAGTVAVVYFFLNHLSKERDKMAAAQAENTIRQDARDDRLFATITEIAKDKGDVIRANTVEIRSLNDMIAAKTGTLAAQVEESTHQILTAIEEKKP